MNGKAARWLARRIGGSLFLAFLVVTIVFFTLHLVPGDPAVLLLSTGGTAPSQEQVMRLRDKLGLDRPLIEQYWTFLSGIVQGDLGKSLQDDYPVASEIALRLPRTLELIFAAVIIGLAVGFPSGVKAAFGHGGWFDRIASGTAALLMAVPVFVVGTLLVLAFAVQLRWMPAGGFTPISQDPVKHLTLLALPALTIAKGLAATVFRMTKASVLDVMTRDHVRTARAKGLTPRRITMRHVVRNALSPVVTVVGLQIGTLLGGTVLVEYVFNWPGLSSPLIKAVEGRDYPMVAGIVLTISGLFLLINLIMDLLYAVLDPRVRP